MAKKISELDAASALAGTEDIAVVQSGATKKATPAQAKTYVLSATLPLIPTSGASANIKVATALLADLSTGATATDLIPAGSVLLAVTTYVTEEITGASVTGYTVGDGTDADRWGDVSGTAAGTDSDNADWTDGTLFVGSTTSVVITATGGTFSGGALRIVVHYIDSTAPTS